jgi:flavin-dependent dehydrogenase
MTDVLIIGGGPAGSMAGKLLAEWGRSVMIVTKPPDSRTDLAESLPPSVGKTFERFGVRGDIDAADFVRGAGNTVWWGSSEPRVEPFLGGELGYQVTRSKLESVLLECAKSSGVQVVEATVRAVDFDVDDVGLEMSGASGATVGRGRWILDCSGRTGILARQYRETETNNRTLALAGVWRRDTWPVPDETHTLIESYADGWIWSIPTGDGLRHVTVMVDPGKTELHANRDAVGMYAGELDKSVVIGPMLEGATQVGTADAIDSSWYCASEAAGDRYLLVGDAASFIDPMSSYGVKKALASAYVAAVVTHTCLRDAEHDQVKALYNDIERRMFVTAQRAAASFFRDGGGHAFWAERGDVPLDVGGSGSAGDVETLKTDPEVLAAFESIRTSEGLALRSSGASRIDRMVIGERFVEPAAHLVNPNFPEGIRYLRGVNLPVLVDMIENFDQVPDLYEAYVNGQGPVVLPDFLGALAVLLGKGLVENV